MANTTDSAAEYFERGNAHLAKLDWACAAACFREGLNNHSDNVDLRAGLGIACLGLGALSDAVGNLRAAAAAAPSHLSALRHLAAAFTLLGRRNEAASTWTKLGSVFESLQHIDDAYSAYRSALTQEPACGRAIVGLGRVHLSRGEPRDAALQLEAAITMHPNCVAAHVLLSQAYHLLGDHAGGLREFGWLTHPHSLRWRAFDQPLWDGASLDGQTILLWMRPGSGLGDAIQFLRYAPLVKRLGATVAVECHPELLGTVERMSGIDIIVAKGDPLPPFNVHAPLPRLPIVIKDAPWPLPMTAPYVAVPHTLVEYWRQYLGPRERPLVGVAWGGNPLRRDSTIRFAPLAAFAPVFRVSGVRFISLQVEPQIADLASLPRALRFEPMPIHLGTPLIETAALIANLDLVVTVDTMVAHLAGAIGKKVWVVLPFAADWRWLDGDKTAWYPTMRLFRQTTRGDWNGVLARVARALEELTSPDVSPSATSV